MDYNYISYTMASHICSANTRQYHQASETPFGQELLKKFFGYRADTTGAKHSSMELLPHLILLMVYYLKLQHYYGH
jgi:hypothetical protein